MCLCKEKNEQNYIIHGTQFLLIYTCINSGSISQRVFIKVTRSTNNIAEKHYNGN